MQWRIIKLFEFSSIDVLLMAGIFMLVILYIALLIHLKPSLKSKKSTEADLNSEILQQNREKEPVETPVRSTTSVKTKVILEELPTSVEPLKEQRRELQIPEEPAPSPPKEASEMKELFTHKAKKIQKKDGPPGCSNYFGYLGELPKNTPIPDECLGCFKIMECLIKPSTKSKT